MRPKMLEKLYVHQGHLGMEKTKQRAQQTQYWPGLNTNIENLVSTCATCQESRNANPREPLNPHKIPKHPWQVVGTDIFHWNNHNFLVVVDYYRCYFEIAKLQSMKTVCSHPHEKDIRTIRNSRRN